MTTHELRNQVMAMESSDCRRELAETLWIIDRLEADLETLAIEVMSLRYNRTPSKRFRDMCDLRGIKLPSAPQLHPPK